MIQKECRICFDTFEAKTERRELCDKCQKNSGKAQYFEDKRRTQRLAEQGLHPNQQYYESTCKQCGRVWHNYGRVAELCGPACTQQYTAERATCRTCNTPLYPLGIICVSGKGYCSELCREQFKLKEARENGKIAICLHCKQEFIKKKEWDEFCCVKCRDDHKWAIAVAQGLIGICVVCGERFIKDSTDDERNTCKSKCYDAYRRENTIFITSTCEVCGSPFTHHPNLVKYTCSKECRAIRNKKR